MRLFGLLLLVLLSSVAHATQAIDARAFDENGNPVAPRLAVASGMAYVVDPAGDGKGEVLKQLHPSEIMSNSHAGSNLARSMVYAGPHATVELYGPRSAVHLKSGEAKLFIRINGDDPEIMRGRVHLLRLKPEKERRQVAGFSQNIFGGQHAKHYDDVPIQKSDAVENVWLRVIPQAPLAPGEYGLVFMPKDANLFPDVVYDFEVAGSEAPGK